MLFSEETKKVFSKFKEEMEKTLNWISMEVGRVRGGKISPELLSNLKIEAYGKKLFLKELAGIFLQGPRTLIIEPWDKSLLSNIEKEILKSSLGGNLKIEKEKIFLSFQSISEEERTKIMKLIKERIEESKRRFYKLRDEAWSKIQKFQREKIISEDEKYRAKKELEEIFQEYLGKIKELKEKKEKEILF